MAQILAMEKKKEMQKSALPLAEKLRTQILYGCGEKACIGIFCKISDVESFADEIVHILLQYGDYFTCRSLYLAQAKVEKKMQNEESIKKALTLHPNISVSSIGRNFFSRSDPVTCIPFDYACQVLDYLYQEIQNSFTAYSVPSSPFVYSRGRYIESDLDRKAQCMEIARIIHQRKSKATSIILQGLFYYEINRVQMSYSLQSAIRAIKLFNAVKESVKFEKKYFIRFLGVVEKMCADTSISAVVCTGMCHRMPGGLCYNLVPDCGYTEEEEFFSGEYYIQEIEKPTGKEREKDRESVCMQCGGCIEESETLLCSKVCYTSSKLCINEVVDLIKSLIIVIDNTSIVNMREGTLLLAILRCLKALFSFSVEKGCLHHSVFVNKRFSRLLNYKIELKYHKDGGPSILEYPFILDMAAKSDLIMIENTNRMKSELQDAFFRSLFEGVVPPYLNFEVKRDTLVDDSLKLLRTLEKRTVWKQLKIKFLGEDGIDSGGIKKEFFQILSQRTLEHWDIFEERNGFVWLKSFSEEEIEKRKNEYYLLGCILGLAAYNGAVLCFYFPHAFYKRMLGYPSTHKDLEQVDPVLFKSLQEMKEMSADEIASLGLTFTKGKITDISVTKDNIDEFIQAYEKEVLEQRMSSAFESIRKGLWSICGDTFIRSLLPCELSILIGGMECQNIEEIEKYTVYNGYRRDSAIVKHFWDIFKGYDRKMQKRFLRFVTGSDRAPSGGLSRMAIIFMRNGGDTDRLPSSQTCFNTFLIPEYSTREKLEEKLTQAIGYTEGFFLL